MVPVKPALNEEKTCLRDARRESFNFLGYTFGPEALAQALSEKRQPSV